MTSSLRLPLWILGISVVIALVAGGITAAVMAAANAPSDAVPESVISADTRMGAVELKSSNIEAMTDYYGPDGVGLSVLGEEDGIRSLGVDGEELVRLVPSEAGYAAQTEAGLYHTAILFPDAPALAETLVQLAGTYPGLYSGAADHAVSHAFYFGDPEGNGVELYVDTPREDWVWEDGHVKMGSEPLDINRFINDNLGNDSAGDATMGHVHLKVGNLEQAEAFYGDTLGFAVTARANGAIFLAAGGYHHHLAANTWGSAGAGVRSDALGLGSLEVVLPEASDLDAVASRLTEAGLDFEQSDAAITVADPWGTIVELSVAS